MPAKKSRYFFPFFKIKINENKASYQLLGDENICFITINDFTGKNCYFSKFINLYLFCCGITDFIKCYDINVDTFFIENEFNLLIFCDNSYIKIKLIIII